LNLNLKAVKAEFSDEKEKFSDEKEKFYSWWFNFQVEAHSEGCEWIYKLNLNLKAVKAEFSDEKEKFSSWWFNFQVEYWISSWISMWRLWRPSVKAVRWEREV
jgi:hypothetical protein